jgi:hypothetical protein
LFNPFYSLLGGADFFYLVVKQKMGAAKVGGAWCIYKTVHPLTLLNIYFHLFFCVNLRYRSRRLPLRWSTDKASENFGR